MKKKSMDVNEYNQKQWKITSEIIFGIANNVSAKRLKELLKQAKDLMETYGPKKDKKVALQKMQELINRVK